MFGKTAANNWTIHEGPDPREYAIVARAQGLHLNSGNWHNSFTIVFENDVRGIVLHSYIFLLLKKLDRVGYVGPNHFSLR
jgi:hypothetical protein